MRVIEKATAKDKDEILKLYKSQLGRKYCPWNDDYPSMETIDFDLSRDALLIMRAEGKIIAAISVDDDEEVNNLKCWTSELQPGGELSRLAVSPDCQSKGLAKEMIETASKLSNHIAIDYKKLFVDVKLNKIVYVDKENNVYVSGIELYNIKEKHDNLEIYINSTNMNDYIVVEEEYY